MSEETNDRSTGETNYVDSLLQRSHKKTPLLFRITQQKYLNPDLRLVFVEGPDDFLFFNHVFNKRNKAINFHISIHDGKRGVLEARENLRGTKYYKDALFFIDRDLDDFLNQMNRIDEQTFISDGYSIENYFVKNEVLNIFLQTYCDPLVVDSKKTHILSNFSKAKDSFVKKQLFISATVIYLRKNGLDVQFDRDMPRGSIHDDNARLAFPKNAINDLSNKLKTNLNLSDARKIFHIRKNALAPHGDKYVRGKSLIFFLISFLERNVANHVRNDLKVLIRSINSFRMIILCLGPSIEIPVDLRKFIAKKMRVN